MESTVNSFIVLMTQFDLKLQVLKKTWRYNDSIEKEITTKNINDWKEATEIELNIFKILRELNY